MIFIGIDPSINSSGVWVSMPEGDRSFVLCGKITRTQKKAQEQVESHAYVSYDKTDLNGIDDNHTKETIKTFNLLNIREKIKTLIDIYSYDDLVIVMEGISYGSSVRTVSVFDLAGLNYLLRSVIYGYKNAQVFICPPSEIKKFATGAGNANKDLMVKSFLKINPNYEVIPKVDDISDAYFMCEYGKKLVGKSV